MADTTTSEEEYVELLKARGAESITPPQTVFFSVADRIFDASLLHSRLQSNPCYTDIAWTREQLLTRMQLVGMVESFDQNGRNLTPTFKEV